MRLDYAAVAPEATKALAGVNAALLRAGLDKRLGDLLFLACHRLMVAHFALISMRATCDRLASPMSASMASPDGGKAPISQSRRRLR